LTVPLALICLRRLPTTWPLVRETLPVAAMMSVFEPVVMLPSVNVRTLLIV
jgi:hypothetical protein